VASGTLDRDEVVAAVRDILPLVEALADDVRIVGTASSRLRGIDLPVADVDILARQRAAVDALTAGAIAAGGRCRFGPAWLENPDFGQYFTEIDVAGVRVELCTVEAVPGGTLPFGECAGSAPWDHFDVVVVDGHRVPLVASELRLLSEVARFRPDHWRAIGAHLSREGYDEDLFGAAIEALAPELRPVMQDAVREPRR
jgi:hypothetical protein